MTGTTVSREAMEKAKAMFPAKTTETIPSNGSSSRLDVSAYLENYDRRIVKTVQHGTATLYCLERCVFDEAHVNNEAAIGQDGQGSLLYQCFHDSCQGRTWKEARQIISGNDGLSPFITGRERTEERRPDNKPDPADPSIFVSITSLLDVEEPNRPDLWEGEIPQGALVGISGQWGSMKSYLMQALGLRAAQGQPFLGRRLLPVDVFYFDRENPKSVWRRRMLDLAGQDRPGRFYMMTLFGPFMPPAFDTAGVAFYSKLAELHPDSLFIFDSLVRFYPSGKQTENTEDAIHAMTSLKSFTRWGTTVSFLHHPTKSGGDFRGGGDLQAAPDLLFTLTHDKKARRLTLECTKNRFEEEHTLEMGYELTPEGGLVFVDMATAEEMKRRDANQEQVAAVLEIIKELYPKGESTKRRIIDAGKERLKAGQKTLEHILDNGVDVAWTCTKTSTKFVYAPLSASVYLGLGVHPQEQNDESRSNDKGKECTSDKKQPSGTPSTALEESVPTVPPPFRGSTEYTHGPNSQKEHFCDSPNMGGQPPDEETFDAEVELC